MIVAHYTPNDASASVTDTLHNLGYAALFLRVDTTVREALWEMPGAPETCARLVLDSLADLTARLCAAEMLFHHVVGYPAPAERATLAELYAAALVRNSAGVGNPWGIPGESDGEMFAHVVSLGDAAIAPFRALLHDETPLAYAGSKEATFGNSYHMRVKDLAAMIIARVLNRSFVVDRHPSVRDSAITQLERDL